MGLLCGRGMRGKGVHACGIAYKDVRYECEMFGSLCGLKSERASFDPVRDRRSRAVCARREDGTSRDIDRTLKVRIFFVPYAGDEQANVSPTAAALTQIIVVSSTLCHEQRDVTPSINVMP